MIEAIDKRLAELEAERVALLHERASLLRQLRKPRRRLGRREGHQMDHGELQDKVLEAVDGVRRSPEIARVVGCKRRCVGVVLGRLVKKGLVVRVGRGDYRPAAPERS